MRSGRYEKPGTDPNGPISAGAAVFVETPVACQFVCDGRLFSAEPPGGSVLPLTLGCP